MSAGEKSTVFQENEERANRYTAFCLLIAAGVSVLMWLLNILGFFIVEEGLMNLAMPAGVLLFLLPSLLVRVWKRGQRALKYVIMGCFLLGIGILATALTIQLVLAWACPLILSCHYYSPRFTHFTLTGVLLCMFFAIYIPIIIQLGIAGSLMNKIDMNESSGTLKTNTMTFAVVLVVVVYIFAALTFLPALALGPISELLTL